MLPDSHLVLEGSLAQVARIYHGQTLNCTKRHKSLMCRMLVGELTRLRGTFFAQAKACATFCLAGGTGFSLCNPLRADDVVRPASSKLIRRRQEWIELFAEHPDRASGPC